MIRVRIWTPRRASGSTSSCTSSKIKRSGCGSACKASASSARNSGWAPARHAHRPCNRLDCGTDGQPAIAATTAAHNRLGSLSSRSTPTQAVSTPVLMRDQSASNNVFPYPGGAQTNATSAPAPASRPAHSSARATNPDGSDGTVIFTRGTSTTAISSSLPSEAGHGGSDGPYFPGNACLIPVWVRSSCCLRPVGDPIHHQLGRPDPPPGRRRVAMAVAATTRPLSPGFR